MRKNKIKMAFATICVAAVGIGGGIAYKMASQTESDILLEENIEALSMAEQGSTVKILKCIPKSRSNKKGAVYTYQCEDGTDYNTIKKCATMNNFFLFDEEKKCWISIK